MSKLLIASILIPIITASYGCAGNSSTADTASSTSAPQAQEKSQVSPVDQGAQPITPKIAGTYAVYAMMASNSYHKPNRVHFDLEKMGWIQVDEHGNKTSNPTKVHRVSGLAYDIFRRNDSNDVVIAIRGTDRRTDYITTSFAIPPFNIQYQQINKEVGEYIKSHPSNKVTVTGHSLGGGLALSASVHHGVDAITFDPSPRIFDGLGDKHVPAKRIVIYEKGEILQALRRVWKKIPEVVSQDDIYECSFDFGKVSKHRGDYLARGLLELGAESNSDLKPVLEALPKDTKHRSN